MPCCYLVYSETPSKPLSSSSLLQSSKPISKKVKSYLRQGYRINHISSHQISVLPYHTQSSLVFCAPSFLSVNLLVCSPDAKLHCHCHCHVLDRCLKSGQTTAHALYGFEVSLDQCRHPTPQLGDCYQYSSLALSVSLCHVYGNTRRRRATLSIQLAEFKQNQARKRDSWS